MATLTPHLLPARVARIGFVSMLWLAATAHATPLSEAAQHQANAPVTLEGLVYSTRFGQAQRVGNSYHLMLLAAADLAKEALTSDFTAHLQTQLHQILQRQGYGTLSNELLAADVVIVARVGIRADQPDLEAVLANHVDPDQPMATGVRFVQLEAYDLPQYAAFLRKHANAADDVNFQFQNWRTTVESRGRLADVAQVVPTLLGIASDRLGTEMTQIERFAVPLLSPGADPH